MFTSCLLFVAAANTNREDFFRTEANDRTERLLQAGATVAEKGGTARDLELHRLEDHGNRRGGANVIDGDLRGNSYEADALPNGMTFRALNEEITFAGIEVRGGNRDARRERRF